MVKKKVVIHSNSSKSNTGFGRHTKAILTYLYKTGKYDLVEYRTGSNWSNEANENMPWKTYGTLPDTQEEFAAIMAGLNQQDQMIKHRDVSYGSYNIDRLIKQEKPDVYIGVEDIWAFSGYASRKWWNKITSVVHTTLDSLPILPDAVSAANDIKNYYVWAKFAETAMAKLGHKHIKTVHGALESDKFFRLPDSRKLELRKKYKIAPDAFIIGFVFRNQLRKSVVKLLQGFKDFITQNPESKAYLLLHTNWSEGWNIPERIKEIGLDPSRVLTTYVCRACKQYEIKPFQLTAEEYKSEKINVDLGQNKDCPYCGAKKAQVTANTQDGVSEPQLNEIYNLMDVYCHPFTSGGQEIPVQEAKLAELITLVTNYSCGEEYCTPESGGFPLDWEEYREPGTEFIKASTFSSSITKQIKKVWQMKKDKRNELGKVARDFVLKTCDISIVGKAYEEMIDAAPFSNWDWDFSEPRKNQEYIPPQLEDNKEWLKDLYNNILLMPVKNDDSGLLFWEGELKSGKRTREDIYRYFIGVATNDNAKANKVTVKDFFDKTTKKKALIVVKESLGDCFIISSLFPSFKQQYPEHELYIATDTKFAEMFAGNPHVHKVIPYHPVMENELAMIGHGAEKGVVDVFIHATITTQRQLNYLSHDSIALNLNS